MRRNGGINEGEDSASDLMTRFAMVQGGAHNKTLDRDAIKAIAGVYNNRSQAYKLLQDVFKVTYRPHTPTENSYIQIRRCSMQGISDFRHNLFTPQ